METIKQWLVVLLSIFKPKKQQEITYLVFTTYAFPMRYSVGSISVTRNRPINTKSDFDVMVEEVNTWAKTRDASVISVAVNNIIRLPY